MIDSFSSIIQKERCTTLILNVMLMKSTEKHKDRDSVHWLLPLRLCPSGLCLLAVLLMYLMWVQVLDTLEQVVHHRRVSGCPSFHLSVQHGPSFLLAPVAVFFCLLAGLLLLLVGRSIRRKQLEKKVPRRPASDVDL